MIAEQSTAPTEEEHRVGGVTKLRYMQWRESLSSSAAHGLRIEALKVRVGDWRLVDRRRGVLCCCCDGGSGDGVISDAD